MKEEKSGSALRLRFQRGDALAIALVLLAAALLLAWVLFQAAGAEAVTAQVYQDGVLVASLPLERDAVYVVSGAYENTITVQDGRVAVTRSNCPGEDCVHSGWVSGAGRSIVCLPNRVEVRLVGGTVDVDISAG